MTELEKSPFCILRCKTDLGRDHNRCCSHLVMAAEEQDCQSQGVLLEVSHHSEGPRVPLSGDGRVLPSPNESS